MASFFDSISFSMFRENSDDTKLVLSQNRLITNTQKKESLQQIYMDLNRESHILSELYNSAIKDGQSKKEINKALANFAITFKGSVKSYCKFLVKGNLRLEKFIIEKQGKSRVNKIEDLIYMALQKINYFIGVIKDAKEIRDQENGLYYLRVIFKQFDSIVTQLIEADIPVNKELIELRNLIDARLSILKIEKDFFAKDGILQNLFENEGSLIEVTDSAMDQTMEYDIGSVDSIGKRNQVSQNIVLQCKEDIKKLHMILFSLTAISDKVIEQVKNIVNNDKYSLMLRAPFENLLKQLSVVKQRNFSVDSEFDKLKLIRERFFNDAGPLNKIRIEDLVNESAPIESVIISFDESQEEKNATDAFQQEVDKVCDLFEESKNQGFPAPELLEKVSNIANNTCYSLEVHVAFRKLFQCLSSVQDGSNDQNENEELNHLIALC